MSEKAEAVFVADVGQFVSALTLLQAQVDALNAKFTNVGGHITGQFALMDNAAAHSATSMQGAAHAADGHKTSLSGLGHGLFAANEALRIVLSSTTFLDKQMNFLTPTTRGVIGSVQQVTAHMVVFDTILKMVTGHLGPVQAGLGFMAAKSIDATKTYQGLSSAAGTLARSIGALGQAFTHAGAEAATAVGTAASSMLSKVGPFILVAGAIMLVAKSLGLIAKGISAAAKFEDLQVSFATLTNDTEGANKAIAEFVSWADETPFDAMDLKGAARDLLAYGFHLKDLVPTMQDVGDLAAASQRPIADVASAFGQLKVGNFGAAFESFRRFGVTLSDLKGEGLEFDQNNSYQGSVETAMTAVHNIVNHKFNGAMKDLSGTWDGMITHLGSKVGILYRKFGDPIKEALKPALAGLIGLVGNLAPAAAAIGEVFARLARSGVGLGAMIARHFRVVIDLFGGPLMIVGRQVVGVFKEVWGIIEEVARLMGGSLYGQVSLFSAVLKPVLTFLATVLAMILAGVRVLVGMLHNAIEAALTLMRIAPFLVPTTAAPVRTGGREEPKDNSAEEKKIAEKLKTLDEREKKMRDSKLEMSSRRQLGAGSLHSGIFGLQKSRDHALEQLNVQREILNLMKAHKSSGGPGTGMPALEV